MRCPVCMNFVNACSCEDGDWDRVVRKSFNDAAPRKPAVTTPLSPSEGVAAQSNEVENG